MLRWLAAISVSLATPPALQAAEPAPLEPVVVSATRSPAPLSTVPTSITVVDGALLTRDRPGADLSEVLWRVPGLVVRDRENLAQDLQLSLRGAGARAAFGVRGVRLYSDGIPASAPDGQGQLAHLPSESAGRIEVLRGPFSALYGNAAGGVLLIISADPGDEMTIGVRHARGGDGLRRSAWRAGGPWSGGGWRYDRVDLDDAGYRVHSAATRHTEHLGALLTGDGWRLRLSGDRLDLRADDPQGLTAAQVASDRRQSSAGAIAFDTRKTVAQTQGGFTLTDERHGDATFTLTAWDGTRSIRQMLSVPVAAQTDPLSGGGALSLDRGFGGVELRGHWSLTEQATLTAGVRREASAEQRQGFENFVGTTLGVFGALRRDQVDDVTGRDAYLQLAWQPAPRWHAELGVRRSLVAFRSDDRYVTASNPDDSGQLDFADTAPVAGLLWQVDDSTGVFANAGRGFETPTAAELAYRPDGTGGLNTTLSAATSVSVEAGLRHATPRHQHEWVWFRTRTADEIVVAASAGGRTSFRNGGRTRREGLEWAASGRLGPGLGYAWAATWLDARYAGGRRLPGLAREHLWAELVWDLGVGWEARVEGRRSGPVPADDAGTGRAPGWARLDLSLGRRWQAGDWDLEAWARVDNLTDRTYIGSVIVNEQNGRFFEPAAGRRAVVGVGLRRAWP